MGTNPPLVGIVRQIVRLLRTLASHGFSIDSTETERRDLLLRQYVAWLGNGDSEISDTQGQGQKLQARPLVGIGVMVVRNGEVLLGRRRIEPGANTFAFCGGHLEYGETLFDCAEREVLEETNLTVTSLRLIDFTNLVDMATHTHYFDIEFVAEVNSGEPILKEPDKVEAWKWYGLTDLPTPLFRPAQKSIIRYSMGKFIDTFRDYTDK